MIRILSVRTGRVAPFPSGGGDPDSSAIRKTELSGGAALGTTGLEGDEVYERHVHGGPERALHVFARESYAHFESLAGQAFPPSTFGENVLLEGYDETEARPGDRLRIGTALVEVSMPTERCAKPGLNAGVPQLLKWIIESGRSGWYVRVIEPGTLAAGEPAELVARGPEGFTLQQLGRAMFHGGEAEREAILAIEPLSEAWKERFQVLLERRRS